MNSYSVKRLFLLLAAVAVFVPSAYVIWGAVSGGNAAKSAVRGEFEKTMSRVARTYVEDTIHVCQMAQRLNSAKFEAAGALVREKLQSLGSAQTTDQYISVLLYPQDDISAVWQAEIPSLVAGETALTPVSDADGKWLRNNSGIAQTFAFIKNDSAIDVSILVKIDEAGRFARLATTLESPSGTAMLGSVLGETSASGEISRTLLARRQYNGVSKIGAKAYLAVYEPILDQYGDVVGAVEYLQDFDDFEYVFDNFEGIRIGEEGYLWGFQFDENEGATLKFFRASKDNPLPDSDIRNLKEVASDVGDIVDAAVSAGEGKVSFRTFDSIASAVHEDAVVAYSYFKPWNMVVGATLHKDNFDAGCEKIAGEIDRWTLALVFVAAAVFGLAAVAAALLANALRSRIATVERALRASLSDRNAAGRILGESRGVLRISDIERMGERVAAFSEKMARCGDEIGRCARLLSAEVETVSERVGTLEKHAVQKAAKLAQVQGALTSAGVAVSMLGETSAEIAGGVAGAIAEMKDGAALLSALGESAKNLVSDSQNIALQLSDIKDKSDKIAAVVDVIKMVGERINMLSVNASVEAERAAETSGGFKTVAAEINKLSDSTAVSAMRISEMAAAMCRSVKAGVDEMRNFSAIMSASKESIKNVRETIVAAQNTAVELSPKFDDLLKGIAAHAESISGMEEILSKLSEKSNESRTIATVLKTKISLIAATDDAIKAKLGNISPR